MNPETAFVLNSLSFLFHGFLVFMMAAGFCMLEAGLVQTKNATVQCTKNLGLYSIAILLFWFTGYTVMYGGAETWLDYFGFFLPDDSAVLAPDGEYIGEGTGDYASASHWFFQMVFVGVAASIVSGAVAERVKLMSFFVFVGIFAGIIYPISGAWVWGGGWLAERGFIDFAGATVVHSVGGWAAVTGVLIIGPRIGKFQSEGVRPFLGSNIPVAVLGAFLVWFGWFGFNGGSELSIGSAPDIIAVGKIYVNTNLAAAAAVVTTIVVDYIRYRRIDITVTLNGAIGGLVAISASPLAPAPVVALMIGAVAGALVVFTIPMLDKLKVDDVVGAIPSHLICGVWGTLAVVLSISGDAEEVFKQLLVQMAGVGAIAIYSVVATGIAWFLIKAVMGVRAWPEHEYLGLDMHECGVASYPEFNLNVRRHGTQNRNQ